MLIQRSLFGIVLAAGMALAADPALLNLLPRDPKVVAGLDVDRAKNSPLGQRILSEMKDDDKDFQKFISATGFDPRRDLREIVMSSTTGNKKDGGLVVVRGAFNSTKIASFVATEGATASVYKGIEIWKGKNAASDGGFAFLDSSIALLGEINEIQAAIDRRSAGGGLSAAVQAKVTEWSANNDFWFVSTVPVSDFAPSTAKPGPVQNLNVDSIRAANGGVRFGSNVDVEGEAVTRSDQDATALADVVRFMVSMIRLNENKPGSQDMMKVLDTLQVSTSGPSMRFSVRVPEEQLEKMFTSKGRTTRRAGVVQ